MEESMNMHGRLTLHLVDRNGRVVETRRQPNRIVKTGRLLVAQVFADDIDINGKSKKSTSVTHMAVGSGAAVATDDQTGLVSERSPRKRITDVSFTEFNEAIGTVSTRRVKVTLTAVFDFDEANDPAVPLREAGMFTAATGGVMYNRVVFEPVTKTDTFKLTLLWDITF